MIYLGFFIIAIGLFLPLIWGGFGLGIFKYWPVWIFVLVPPIGATLVSHDFGQLYGAIFAPFGKNKSDKKGLETGVKILKLLSRYVHIVSWIGFVIGAIWVLGNLGKDVGNPVEYFGNALAFSLMSPAIGLTLAFFILDPLRANLEKKIDNSG